MKRPAYGFTLIEILLAVAVIGIITAVALPNYSAYVTRAKLTEAFSALSGMQPNAEQFWANNRTFANMAPLPPDTANFTYALGNASPSTYTISATGIGQLTGFAFTINQNGARATTAVPAGWTLTATCWVDRKSGQCAP